MADWYVVSTATGAADGTSETDAFTTIDAALSEPTLAGGDNIYVKATATYSEQATIDTAGGLSTNIVVEGYTTTVGDNGKVTMSGSTYCITTSLSAIYYAFKNFKFAGASSHGVNLNGTTGDNVGFINCEFTGNGGSGCVGDTSINFYNCIMANNTADGIDCDTSSYIVGCIAYGNGGQQIDSAVSTMYKSVLYGATGSSALCADLGGANCIANTFDGENVATLGMSAQSTFSLIVDNIVYDCVTAIKNSTTAREYTQFHGYNLLNSNTTDYTTITRNTGIQDVTGAPAFTDEANDDYTLQDSSDAAVSGLYPGGIT